MNFRSVPAVLALCLIGHAAYAQYPNRPIRVITAQSAGSSMDVVVRTVMPKVSESLGQSIVIDNRGGAGGVTGVEIAARAAPDGYTLLVGASSSLIVSRFAYRSLSFDALKDFEPITNLVNADAVLVTTLALPAKTVKELIALVASQPGKFNFGSAGVGSSSHLAGTLFVTMAGLKAVHVSYKGGGPAVTALIAGETQFYISPAAAVASHIKSGRVRALAITSKKRSALMPDLPTVDEAGVPEYEYVSWNGLFARRGTPPPVVSTVHAVVNKVLADPDTVRLYAVQGLQPSGSASPEEFAKFFRADFERNAKLVKIAGVKPE